MIRTLLMVFLLYIPLVGPAQADSRPNTRHFSFEQAAPPEEIAPRLSAAVGLLYQDGRPGCTAWKMGPREWATAWHCVALTGRKYTIQTSKEPLGQTLNVRSILLPAEKGAAKDHWEDWAVLNVAQKTAEIPALAIDCVYVPVLGESVSYAGFPSAVGEQILVFSTGIVANITRSSDRKLPWTFAAALDGGGGASGSPVIANRTVKVIGFVTRGVQLAKGGRVLTGIEGVAGMDLCEAKSEPKTVFPHAARPTPF